ncbi:MAG: PilZ domain-containing protein [Pseudomonadota bacterium]
MPTYNGPERRKSKRVSLEIDVEFNTPGGLRTGKTQDAGLDGFFVASPHALAKGVSVPFTLRHPRIEVPFKLVGRVVHIRTGPDKTPVGMGVEIRQIPSGADPSFDQYRSFVEEILYKKN